MPKVDLPSGFPSDFPFPSGTVILSADDRGDAGIVVTAITDTPFQDSLDQVNTGMKTNGYAIEGGESEPHDAEADWKSAQYEGRWSLREASGCDADTAIQVVADAA